MTTASARTVVLTMPLPPRALSPNGQFGHWGQHAKAVHSYRTRCRIAVLGQFEGAAMEFAAIAYRFVYCPRIHRDPRCVFSKHRIACGCDYHPSDLDNAHATAKGLVDGLVDAGVLVRDDARHLSLGGLEIVRCKGKCECGGRVEVTLEERA